MSKKDISDSAYAFIDGQNMHRGISYNINYARFRKYLFDKFAVKKAFYFLGVREQQYESLYKNLERAGFEIIFKIIGVKTSKATKKVTWM